MEHWSEHIKAKEEYSKWIGTAMETSWQPVLLTARYENISWLFYYAEDQKQYPGNE
jgi:hypothetical protein